MKEPTFDKDGYPTEETLRTIREWKIKDMESARELINFCRGMWYWPKLAPYKNGRYEFHTGGWSGNESIIEAMQDNHLFWLLCWLESRRGGHYKFDLKGIPE